VHDRRARITSLDTLRGAGVLGVLLVHVQSFGMVTAVRVNPALSADLHGVDRAVWLSTAVLADGKFISIFATLFGAGLLLFAEGRRDARPSVEALHDRRMIVLLLLGLSQGGSIRWRIVRRPRSSCRPPSSRCAASGRSAG
jgi:uncharacterized protein